MRSCVWVLDETFIFGYQLCLCFLIYFSFLSLSVSFCSSSFLFKHLQTHTHKHTCQLSTWVILHNEHLSPLMHKNELRAQIFSHLFYSNTSLTVYSRTFSLAPPCCLSMTPFEWHHKMTNPMFTTLCSKSYGATLLSTVYTGSSFTGSIITGKWTSDLKHYAKSNTYSTQ